MTVASKLSIKNCHLFWDSDNDNGK